MEAEVAVSDPLPVFRRGVLAVLGFGGVDLDTSDSLDRWLARTAHGILLLTLHDEESWDRLRRLHDQRAISVVAVIDDFSVARAGLALRAGAVHLVPRNASPEAFRAAIADTRQARVTLPIEALRAATSRPREARSLPPPTDDELRWLRLLAAGQTVASLAESVGYSERMMFRKLGDLYRRFGVTTKTQALLLAQDEGWV